ncbi:MAG: type II toxin-antitoxin system VapC family toxin [Candidatus Hydrogenedentes bacterium]|nr:type II toxin-antitoxin system VapC family toxin [Candidatus Hydrogenedentota bacterium]
MKSRVYIESTIFSYLAARPSRDPIIKAHQVITRQWWDTQRKYFKFVISEQVLREIEAGDRAAARRRIELTVGMPVLDVNDEVMALARRLVLKRIVPATFMGDATHIAAATVYGAAYLVTWNCRHIANAELRTAIDRLCRNGGYSPCIICTPEELIVDE